MEHLMIPCSIRLKNVGTQGHVIVPEIKMTKEQKRLLLPIKKSKKLTTAKGTKAPKKGKKAGGKFQMKISGFSGSPSEKDDETEEEDRSSPDSGLGSRSVSPSDSRSNTPDESVKENEDVDEDLEADVNKEKAKFLDDLDGSDDQLSSSSDEEESEDEWKGDDDNDSKKKTVVNRKPAAKGKKGKHALLAPIVIPGAMKSELAMSDYEKIRDNNIKEKDKMLAKLMADFNQYKQDNGLTKQPKKLQKKKIKAEGAFQSTARAPLTMRKSSRLMNQDKKETLGTIEWMTPEGEKRKRLAEEDSDFEEDGDQQPEKKRRCNPSKWASDPNADLLMPEHVTPKMLANISYSSTGKVYNTSTGTTCHQCRQKTVDQKTICRSGECSGVRGMFCGRCLQNRYGEEAEAALMNPNWSCPPCRGFCNCSICRNRNGKGATGILIHLAQSKGYDNVKDYLVSLQKSKGSDEFDE